MIINESPENQSLGRGFKHFLFSPLFVGRFPFWLIFFRSLTAAGCADRKEQTSHA